MRHYLLPLLLLCLSLTAQAQSLWTTHLAYHNAQQCVTSGSHVYGLFGGNLLDYDTEDGSVQFLERGNAGLSAMKIVQIGLIEAAHTLVLAYADGNIDLVDTRDGTVCNLPQYAHVTDETPEFTRLRVIGTSALLCTSGGVIWVDVARREIRGYYKVGAAKDAAIFDNNLWVAMRDNNNLYRCLLSANMQDISQWQPVLAFKDIVLLPADDVMYITSSGGSAEYVGLVAMDALPEKQGDGWHNLRLVSSHVYRDGTLTSDGVVLWDGATVACYDGGDTPVATFDALPATPMWVTGRYERELWVCEGMTGIQRYKVKDGQLQRDDVVIGGYGPHYDQCYNMHFEGNRLLVAGGYLDCENDALRQPFAPMVYEDDRWSLFEVPTADAGYIGSRFEAVTSFVQDPEDAAHHFVATARTGIYEYRDGRIVRQYTEGNSAFRTAATDGNLNYVRTGALIYDKDHNLWAANNSQRDTILYVLRHGEKEQWMPVYVDKLAGAVKMEYAMFDTDGRLWMTQRWWNKQDPGLLCLDYNGTITNLNDDIATYRSSFTNTDGTTYAAINPTCTAQDRSGRIWVGTTTGVFLVDDPAAYSSSNFLVSQVKVPRNDGTNYADYLLGGVSISCIAIDGADRKWIGTTSSGVYLVSSDGLVTIAHFDETNSPLLSSAILSLAINDESGEVFIGTDKGLISYRGDATQPQTTLSRDNIRVFPNPVRPDYYGDITIQGLVDDCEVKIVSTAGQAIAVGRSNGGTFRWDGRNIGGERVATGVYYVMIATADGKQSIAAKLAIVR